MYNFLELCIDNAELLLYNVIKNCEWSKECVRNMRNGANERTVVCRAYDCNEGDLKRKAKNNLSLIERKKGFLL